MSLDIVAVGHIINETIVFPGKETRSVLGSPPAYSMSVAARVGARVGVFTRIGSDYPERLLDPLRECGVDLAGVLREGDASTNNQLVYATDGSKTIHYLSRAPLLEPEDLPEPYRDAKLIYICPMDWDCTSAAVEDFGRLPGLLATDLGGFGGAHSPPGSEPQMERDPDAVRRIIRAMDIVKASDEDCCRLTGNRDLDLEAFARQWLDWGAKVAVVTLGSAGTLVITADEKFDVPPLPGEPIDATGGGDSYMGGFLVGYLRTGGDAWEAGLYGAATALMVIEGTGGVTKDRMPTQPQVEARLAAARSQLNL